MCQEAERKLREQPGAQQYLVQLGTIKTYSFASFYLSDGIYIDADIQAQPVYPFTMESALRLFGNFRKERFAFQGEVKSIRIYAGKEALPRHSFASGWLYEQTLDDLERTGTWPEGPIGSIHFEFGGSTTVPYVAVQPEPNWPRPSIVRRTSVGRGAWFEELP